MREFHATPEVRLGDMPSHAIAELIDRAIAELDARDGDPDLEDSNDFEHEDFI